MTAPGIGGGLLLVLCQVVSSSRTVPPWVMVPGLGELEGTSSQLRHGVAIFNGIPYARAPVDDLRWRPPVPHGPWQSPRNASYLRSGCITLWRAPEKISQSEDCLFLNIATPEAALSNAASSLPVMVYLHGGAFSNGNSNHGRLDTLVNSSGNALVVVNLNYRLNVFGFLGATALKGRGANGGTGNYGIEDQRLALSWVQQHIKAFGGNGDDVTIFGESAGGSSVLNHLLQPMSFGLYRKAIIESGAEDLSFPLHVANAMYSDLLVNAGCKDVACLLKLPSENVTAAAPAISNFGTAWGPVIDNVALHGTPQELIFRGEYNNKVPIIIGSNRDETTLWLADPTGSSYVSPNLTEEDLDAKLSAALGYLGVSGLRRAKETYDASVYSYPADLGKFSLSWWKLMRMATDGGGSGYPSRALGHCSVRRLARLFLRGGSPRVFTYMFSHPSQEGIPDMNEGGIIAGTEPNSTVVPHASELPYVFGWHEILKGEGEKQLAMTTCKYWSRFALQGDPNGPTLPDWPNFGEASDALMQLDVDPSVKYNERRQACDLWDKYAWRSDSSSSTQISYV